MEFKTKIEYFIKINNRKIHELEGRDCHFSLSLGLLSFRNTSREGSVIYPKF